jgi:hypothetical protein
MHNKFLEITPPIPGSSNNARLAVNAALDAMSAWRNASKKSGAEVVEKMAAAAKAVGWPEQVVDMVRLQIQSVTEIQIKTMDQIMGVWERQLKLLDSTAAPTSSWPGAGGFEPINPMQAWLQFLEQWQKNSAEAMAMWVRTAKH